MKKTTLALASAATLALAAGAVHAQGPERAMRGADVSRAAAETEAAAAFARMDANSDGVLDPSDREARQAQRGERRAERFERLDADSDGAISRAEFEAAHEQGHQRFAQGEGRRDGAARRGRGGHRWAGFGGSGRGLLAGADGDGDMTVTQAEFTAAALDRFDRADTDRDGTVTRAERRAAMKAFRSERRAAREARS